MSGVMLLLLLLPSAERELSLEEVLRFAEEQAPALAVAEGRVAVAAAGVVAASPWLPADPSVDVGAGGRVGGGQDGADFSVSFSQPLELFGEGGLRQQAAERDVDSVRADAVRARFEVRRRARWSFQHALLADAELVAAGEARAFAQRLVEVAEARVAAGEASALTVRLAKTARWRAQEQQQAAQQHQRAARLSLGRAAGFGDALAIVPRGALEVPAALPSVDALVALADTHQLAGLRAAVKQAEARQALAEREAWPKPTVGLGYAVEGAAPSSSQTQQLLHATLALPLPFVRGNDAERARTSAEQRLREAELDGQRRLLAGRVAEAWSAADAARARVLLFRDEIGPGLDETLQQLERGFQLGELELTEVMVGREQLLAARRDALTAWRAWTDARAALEAEIGADLP